MNPNIFDESSYRWINVREENEDYEIHHDYTILGYDLDAGRLDMLVRWYGDGGHCIRHRHSAITTSLVISGEHHLIDLYEGGRTETRIKKPGDYGLSAPDAVPHLERGGPEGAVVYFGAQTNSGVLYELIDADLKVVHEVTIAELVAPFQES